MKSMIGMLVLGGVLALAACGDNRVDPDRRYLVEPRASAAQVAKLYPNETPELRALINKWADHYDVPRDLVHAQVSKESRHQPQVRAGDGSLYGAEVLLRWNHPTEGTLAPGAFMHVAERLRLVPDIDRIVMEKSRDVIARWRAQGLVVPKISLNVSAGRMHDPSILEFAAKFAEIDTRLTFELLESILVEEENQAFRDNLATIRAAGVEIEIDDFGSGHASIIGLMEIEPSALKIDQRIVFPVVHEQRARDLVRAIVQIAAALGIRTVAEGVETADHVRILRALGCEVLQGYHFARPLSEAQFLAYAQAGHASGP